MKPSTRVRRTLRSLRSTDGNARPRVLFPQARFLTPNERAALNAYTKRLLTKLPGQIERIILYGSRARGEGTTDSDVDLLVVLGGETPERAGQRDARWEMVVDPAYDVLIEYGVDISPVMYHADSLRHWNPFFAHVQQDGVQLWRRRGAAISAWTQHKEKTVAEAKEEAVKTRMILASDKLHAAKNLVDKNFYRDAISSAYYAMFYASKAMLLALGEDPHKHQGVISFVNKRIVRMGYSDSKYGKVVDNAFKLRLDAGYNFEYVATEKDAREAIRDAEDFVNEAHHLLQRIRREKSEKQDSE